MSSFTTTPKRPVPRLGPFLLLKTLGVGEFGKVKMGRHYETGQTVAVKLVKKENIDSSSQLEKIRMEIDILKTLNHPYIVKLLSVNETNTCIGMVLEYAQGGELFDYIYKQRYLKEHEARRLFSQLISSENILLDSHGNLIVTDFGFANQFTQKTGDLMSTSCGSPVYAAPELVMTGTLYAGTGVDIWSCGIILYAMLCGYLPFDDDIKNPNGDNIGRLYRYIMANKPKYPVHLSDDSKDIIGKMLIPDPNARCKVVDIMNHPWLSKYKTQITKPVHELELEGQILKQSLLKGIEPKSIQEDDDYVEDVCCDQDEDVQSSACSARSSVSSTYSFPPSYSNTKRAHNDDNMITEERQDQHLMADHRHTISTTTPQDSSMPPIQYSSLRAKLFSSVKRRNHSETAIKEDTVKEVQLKKKTNRNSWQQIIHRHTHNSHSPNTLPVSPPTSPIIPEQSKSVRLISWLKTKTHHKKCNRAPSSLQQKGDNIDRISIESELRVHAGDMNRSALTSKPPMEVLLEINKILLLLGVEVENQGGYKLNCTRRSTEHYQQLGMDQEEEDMMNHLSTSHQPVLSQPIYGHPSLDNGQEIQFSVEICRFENLSGLFSVDVQYINQDNFSGYQFIGQKLLGLLHMGNVIRNTNFNIMLSKIE
ncbi:kinase-like domain-containing protein [Mucor mucedo]|uniref:kinase-like domain-containing protein n=1 Tax=Mucor mucedo TaxID=29922 RepID=UPI00221EA409|nr:kinase-like domain-containing protein [Mucor mucedo]KAI7867076.1 kinase-like domain-containing protein [Mucor mucedo]